MAGDVTTYTDLVPSANSQQPKFMAELTALVQPLADIIDLIGKMPALFDIDNAVGDQLDTDGEWIGASRDLSIPLIGVFFAFDTEKVGFDEGTWLGPYDSTTELTSLPDDSYRTLLRARIANNQWDGTIPSAYKFLAPVFPGNKVVIQDSQDMYLLMGVMGDSPLNAVADALLKNGYLDVKPAGVRISGYVTQSVLGSPFFGFDAENSTVSGFDTGGWALLTGGA